MRRLSWILRTETIERPHPFQKRVRKEWWAKLECGCYVQLARAPRPGRLRMKCPNCYTPPEKKAGESRIG